MTPPTPSSDHAWYPRRRPRHKGWAAAILVLLSALAGPVSAEGPKDWRAEFPKTDFTKRAMDYGEIRFDGARRDTIPPIDDPRFWPVDEIKDVGGLEPVLSIGINGDLRAYPLRILLWHEIVNDTVGGVPVLVSYCPLCNSGVVFDRRLDGETLSFGNTGRLRNFDMVMYDRATESWWQQFTGEAMMGALTGRRLKSLPARLESLEKFKSRAPRGQVLVPLEPSARRYGTTPYVRMDSSPAPGGAVSYELPAGVEPLSRVVVVGDHAWTLDLLRRAKRIEFEDLILTWEPGQNSIHDTKWIPFGRDVGNALVQRKTETGFEDVAYDVSFAFAFATFWPQGRLHHRREN